METIAPTLGLDQINNTFQPYKDGAFQEYVSYCALGGLITSDDCQLSKMSASQFCQQFGVDRKTTYRWRHTPGFGEKVRARREELYPLARETAVWNRLYLIAMQSKDLRAAVKACVIFLGHFGGLKLPARRQPDTRQPNNLAEMLSNAEKIVKAEKQEAMNAEGEI